MRSGPGTGGPSALDANIKAYGIDPRLNVAVHGPNGGLSIEATLANNQRQVEAARKFCADQQAMAVFGYQHDGPDWTAAVRWESVYRRT